MSGHLIHAQNLKLISIVAALMLLGACATTSTTDQAGSVDGEDTKTATAVEPPTPALEAPVSIPVKPAPPPKPPITIIGVGDIMIGTDFPEDRLPPEDGATSFSVVAEQLRDADITFGNLEGVLQDGGEPFKVCKNPKLCYLFRTPTRYAQYFAEAGFDVMSLANNHARDFGEEGRDASMRALAQWGIMHSGRIGDVASWQVGAYKVALIAFAPNPDSHDINDIELAAGWVASLDAEHDLVLVSFHGGAEGLDALHVSFEMEEYYGEQRGDLVNFAHRVIDAGADLVIGHGPHVPRALELYNDRLIAYSLGNFNTYQGISIKGIKGLAPILKVTLNERGEFEQGQIISTRQQRPGGPILDDSHEAARLMQQLSLDDFGVTELTINDSGQLSRTPSHTTR